MEGNPFTTVGNRLAGSSWDCLIDLNVQSTCCLDHRAGYVNEISMENDEYRFLYFPSFLIWWNDDKKHFHQENNSSV